MKTTIKHENDEFLVMPLKHVLGLWGVQISLDYQNCGQYLMKTAIKQENDEFVVIKFKLVSGLRVVVNLPETPQNYGQ